MRRLNQTGSGIVEVLLIIVVVAILGFAGWLIWHDRQSTTQTSVNSFADCQKAAGSKLLESYPEQCVTKEGQTFTNPDQVANQTTNTKAPADSPMPAAGTCATVTTSVVTVTLNPDVPSPRCVQVTKEQTLQLKNASSQSVTAVLGGKSVTIPAGQSDTIAVPFGDYLQTGDHVVQTGLYGGSGPEIYLPVD
jgi:hypothetical protein